MNGTRDPWERLGFESRTGVRTLVCTLPVQLYLHLQKVAFRNGVSSSTVWVLGTKFRSSGLIHWAIWPPLTLKHFV